MRLGSIAADVRNRGRKRRLTRTLVMLVAAAAVALIGWTTAASAGTPTITTKVDKFSFVHHYDACGSVPANTEYGSGTEHLQIVRDGDDIHVAFGDTFQISEVYDDPAIPTRERRGSDAGTFQLVNNGAVVVFHESFHDLNTDFGDIFFITTFHAVNGEVLVDHTLARNPPPEGC
jgi:hypothetical protein